MVSVLAIAHIILSVFLILLVLIQDPKGGGVGGMFGGGGGGGANSLFGATGAPSFLARLTRWVAVIFAGSCIAMTIFIKPSSDSVLDSVPMDSPQIEEKDASPSTPPDPMDSDSSTQQAE